MRAFALLALAAGLSACAANGNLAETPGQIDRCLTAKNALAAANESGSAVAIKWADFAVRMSCADDASL